MPESPHFLVGALPGASDVEQQAPATWTAADRTLGGVACYIFFALSLAYAALVLAAPAFPGGGLAAVVRRGLLLSGGLSLAGLLGAALGNMDVRNIGIIGYALVLPVVSLGLARVFSLAPLPRTYS
jgi:hypothetical protein